VQAAYGDVHGPDLYRLRYANESFIAA
jgi:hypothetical protein